MLWMGIEIMFRHTSVIYSGSHALAKYLANCKDDLFVYARSSHKMCAKNCVHVSDRFVVRFLCTILLLENSRQSTVPT